MLDVADGGASSGLRGTIHRPALDADVLDELEDLAGTSDLIAELAEVFLADAEIQVTVLEVSLAGADSARLAHAAHQLRGSAANVGAAELARLCSLLPTGDGPLDESGVALVLSALRTELSRVRSAFSERVSPR
jgi:Hpt domain-containing protein